MGLLSKIRSRLSRKKGSVTQETTSPTTRSAVATDFSSGESVVTKTETSGGKTTTTRTVSSAGGGSVSSAREKELIEATKRLEEQQRQKEAQRQAEAKKQAEIKRQQQLAKIQQALDKNKQSTILESQIREGIEQRRKDQEEEARLKRDIDQLERQRLASAQQSITKEAFDKILADKKAKEQELRLLQSGVTNYNKRVDKEVNKAQTELDNYINSEASKLQARVNSGELDVPTANSMLETRANTKQREINKILNDRISQIPVPDALKVPVNTVEVAVPRSKLQELKDNIRSDLGIISLSEGLEQRITAISKIEKGGVGKEILIGASIGLLSFGKGVVDLPKSIITLIKKPSLIKNIPSSIKQSLATTGESLKVSPTRTVVRIGTELFLMDRAGKVIGEVSKSGKAKLSSQLEKAGSLSRIRVKFIGGKVPKIKFELKNIEKSIKPVASTKNINAVARDISKLIPKTVSKAKVSEIIKLSKSTIKRFLNDKRIIAELRRKYPNTTRFTLRQIKSIRSYPRLRTVIKRDVFSKYSVKAIRKAGRTIKKKGRRISGVKVRRKEFKSFQEANKEFQKLKRLGKFVKKIESKGGAGRIESLPKRPINAQELEYFKIGRKIPRNILKDVNQVSVNTFTQKFSARVPILKRFGDLKNGYWKTLLKDKEFYQNSVSFSLYKKGGKPVGTITFNTISSKPITRFRSLTNALKWGTNKEVVLSKLVGNDFVRSYVLKARGNKITSTEFLSKIKVTSKGEFQDILIATKKVPVVTTRRSVKKQFKRSIPVSATKGRIKKVKQASIIRYNKKKGVIEIVQRGKTVKLVRTKSIINPVIIDTSKIEYVVRQLNSLKNKALSKAKLNRIKQYKRLIDSTKSSKVFVVNGKSKIAIPKSKLKQINKIAKETRVLKESLAGRSIPPRIKITRRVEGIKQLKKLKRTEQALKKVRNNLIKRNALDVGSKLAIAQTLSLVNKFKRDLKKGQIILTDQATKQIQANIQKGLLKSKEKTLVKTIKLLQMEFPPLLLVTRIPRTPTPRIPKLKSPKIRLPSKRKEQEKEFKTFAKPVKIFSVIVKKRGKALVVNNKLTERDALNFMALKLDNELLRTARLKQTGTSKKARKLPIKYNGAFEKRKAKFRQYRIKQKKKVPIRGFIEKRKYALDTPGEKTQLKRLTRKSIKKKTTRTNRKIVVRKKPIKRKVVKKKAVKKKVIKKPIKKRTVKRKK